jgi:hypothetical protein
VVGGDKHKSQSRKKSKVVEEDKDTLRSKRGPRRTRSLTEPRRTRRGLQKTRRGQRGDGRKKSHGKDSVVEDKLKAGMD